MSALPNGVHTVAAKRSKPEPNPRSFRPTKIYCGKISQKFNEEELKELCKTYGRVLTFFYLEDCSGCDAGWFLATYECLYDANNALAGFKNTHKFETRMSSSQNFAGGMRMSEEQEKEEREREQARQDAANFPSVAMKMQQQAAVAAVQQTHTGNKPTVGPARPDEVPRWGSWREYVTKEGHKYYYNVDTQQTTWEKPLDSHFTVLTVFKPEPTPKASLPPGAGAIGTAQGPPGANLFVYHIPLVWVESDFVQHFAAFGRIVMCRIQRDDQGRSKGFGFISYDDPQSALQAIHAMNEFPVDGKNLNVSLKKGEEQYVMGNAAPV